MHMHSTVTVSLIIAVDSHDEIINANPDTVRSGAELGDDGGW